MTLRSPAAALLHLLIAITIAPSAHAQQSIVGGWAIKGQCARPLSKIDIEPRGLSGEDFYCEFDTVARKGDTVRWTGKCNFSENGYEKTNVTAQLRGRKLYYQINRLGWNGPFDRCPR
jgi:hypothetical protein